MPQRRSQSTGKLSDGALKELRLLVQYAESLPEIIAIANKQDVALVPKEVISKVSEESGKPLADLRKVFNALENISSWHDNVGNSDQTIEDLASRSPEELSEGLRQNKSAISEAVTEYKKDNAVSLSYKSQRLAYLRDKLLHKIDLVTDVRPVFNNSGDKLMELVITHELILSLFKDGEFIREHIALDNTDLVSIRSACDRAILKSKSLKDTLGRVCKVEVVSDVSEE